MSEENKEQELENTEEVQASNDSENNPDAVVEITKQELDNLYARLKELEAMKENLQRHAADFENAKKRLAKEREDFVKFGQEKLIKGLLPILDNFQRALSHASLPEEAKGDNDKVTQHYKGVFSGVEMVEKQLKDVMKNEGLVEIESLNQDFDPHKHEALAYVEEDGKPDQIIDVIETGYMLNDRLLRAAKVRVRKAPTEEKSAES